MMKAPQLLVFLLMALYVAVTYGISSHASDAYSQHKRNTERIADQVRRRATRRWRKGRRRGAGIHTH